MEELASPQSAEVAAEGIHPDFVCRLGGLPADSLDALRADRALDLIERFTDLDQQLDEVRTEVSDRLYDVIGDTDDRDVRGALLQVRRDAYNLRPISDDDLAVARTGMPEPAEAAVDRLLALTREQTAIEDELSAAYAEELADARDAFQDLTKDADFQKGLLISSQTLYDLQDRYQDADGADIKSKRERLERGLLRYFSRTAMKATPFGTFCAIVPGSMPAGEADAAPGAAQGNGAPAAGTGLTIHGDPRKKRSTIRLNKQLFGLFKSFLESDEAIRVHLDVELNPTIRPEGERLLFLAEVQHREVFQRLASNPVLDLLKGILDEEERLPLKEMARHVYEHPAIDATEDEVMPYLNRLIEIGFLRFRWGIPEQKVDWDEPLGAFLEPIDDPSADRILDCLEVLRSNADRYDDAPVEERDTLLETSLDEIYDTFNDLDIAGRLRKDIVFYEDATADARVTASPDAVQDIRGDLERYIRTTLSASWPRSEQVTMRHFFDQHYEDSEAASIPLLTFYEDFYREHFKAHLKKERDMRRGKTPAAEDEEGNEDYDVSNPFNLDAVDAIQKTRRAVSVEVARRWAENREARVLHIDPSVLDDAAENVPQAPMDTWSVSMFGQFAPPQPDHEQVSVIVPDGTYFAGYGKYFSRFLYLFPDEVQERMYETNNALTDNHLAEICGDAHFNANLHPPLIEKEISYPTGESGERGSQLRASDIAVEPMPGDAHGLCLRHVPTGKRVLPVDLGFLNPRMRPPLYQLLSRFAAVANFSMSLPSRPVPPDADAAQDADGETTEGETPDAAEVGDEAAVEAGDDAAQDEEAKDEDSSDGQTKNAPAVLRRPRIVLGASVVLARESWHVPSSLVPEREDRESDLAYFTRVQRWRATHDIPNEVYARVRPLPSRPAAQKPEQDAADAPAEDDAKTDANAEAANAEAAEAKAARAKAEAVNADAEASDAEGNPEAPDAEAPDAEATDGEADGRDAARNHTARSSDHHKPQYIDFRNPLLVGLFGKISGDLDNYMIVLEERYPDGDDLPTVDGRPYTNEMIFQFNSAFAAADEAAQ
jgi:hypothetical protein